MASPTPSPVATYLKAYNCGCASCWGIILIFIINRLYNVRPIPFSMIEGLCEVWSHRFSLLDIVVAAAAVVVVEEVYIVLWLVLLMEGL